MPVWTVKNNIGSKALEFLNTEPKWFKCANKSESK